MTPRLWRIAIVVILGAIMSVLDTTIVNVALDTLSKDLNTPLDGIQWVVTGYMLALAAVIPVTGWAAARFGARRLYVISLVLFTAGSALCGFAWSAESLIAARVLQGLGGGMLLPIGQMILVRAAGPKNMARVMSAIGVPIILAPVFGPTLGGLLARARRLAVDLLRQPPRRHRRRLRRHAPAPARRRLARRRPASSTPPASRWSPPASSASPTAWPSPAPPAACSPTP